MKKIVVVDDDQHHLQIINELENIYSNAPIGLAYMNKNLEFVRINRTLAEINGLTVSDHIGRKLRDVMPELAPEIEPICKGVLETGEPALNLEFHGATKAEPGKHKDWLVSYYPISDKDGKIIGVNTIVLEITERIQAKDALKESEDKFKHLFEHIPIGISIIRPNGEIEANNAFYAMLGYSTKDHEFLNWKKITHPKDVEASQQLIDSLISGDKNVGQITKRYLHRDGSEVWTELNTALRRDEEGNPKYFIASINDITSRMRSEQSLLRMKRLLNDAQELGRVGAWEFDPTRKFCYWTDNMHRLLGYEPGEIADKYQFFFKHVIHPDDRAKILDQFQRLVKDRQPLSAEFRALHKDGRQLIFHGVMAPVLDSDDRLSRIYGTSVDISEQKRMDDERRKLQEQILKAQKMESIGALAGGIAHDFNNILSAVIGYSEIAWEQAGDVEAARESLKEVLQASRRAKDLVAQILAFSRHVDQEFAPVQIQLIVKEVCKLLRATLPSNITIETDIQSFASVMADAGQVHQVLMNLCTNAYQSMNDTGGTLTLKLNEIELDQPLMTLGSDLKPGKYLEIIVQDNGCGMDEATMNRIFDPYFSTKNPDEGTGLGLSVVFGIVKSHGGIIDVESKVRHGSTFRILIPTIKKAATRETDDYLDSAEGGNERILFVDDELLLAKMAKQTLESLGYHVQTKTNSVEALEAIQTSPDDYDLIITDMMMPHMTGDHLASEILKIRPDLPMIICTGFSERIDKKEARELGFKAFVRKPWRKAEMAGAIRMALEN